MSLREREAEFRAQVRSDGKTDIRTLPPPNAPMKVARVLAAERYQLEDGTPTLRHWRGGWWEWRRSHWVEIEPGAARAAAYAFTEHALYAKCDEVEPWSPNRHKIADLLEALAAVCHLPESVVQPAWIEGGHDRPIVACGNGLLTCAVASCSRTRRCSST
jgi:putative DNA primase/helicase